MILIRFYILAALAGCAVISNDRVPGWPELAIVEHRVSEAKLRDVCDPAANPLLTVTMACVTFDFKERICHMWLSRDFPPTQWVIEHETWHCRGHDHIGGTTMAGLL